MEDDFKTAKQASKFSYRRHPDEERTFMIEQHKGDKGYETVGDYKVLDLQEDDFLSEKKVMNLIALLNGHEKLADVSKDVEGSRLYYYEDPSIEEDRTRVLFYRHDGQGVSKQNALFSVNKEIWGHA